IHRRNRQPGTVGGGRGSLRYRVAPGGNPRVGDGIHGGPQLFALSGRPPRHDSPAGALFADATPAAFGAGERTRRLTRAGFARLPSWSISSRLVSYSSPATLPGSPRAYRSWPSGRALERPREYRAVGSAARC